MERQFCYRNLAGMPTLGDVRAAVLPLESEATTLATSGCSGAKYSIPIPPDPIPRPHLKQSYPKLTLMEGDIVEGDRL